MHYKAAVVGASGYAGCELVRILSKHPNFELVCAVSDTLESKSVADVYPALTGKVDLKYVSRKQANLSSVDVCFLAVPHTASLSCAPSLVEAGVVVIDLSADFRLKDADVYEHYYNAAHTQRGLLERAHFGLPELCKQEIIEAKHDYENNQGVLVACAGCYPTATSLAAVPALRANLVEEGSTIIVDAISGVSGAGRKPSSRTHFCTANENLSPYGLLEHRHTPEMEQIMDHSGPVLFTPHLAPLNRGLLSTVTMKLAQPDVALSAQLVQEIYESYYTSCSFIHVLPQGTLAQTSSVVGTNEAHLCVAYSKRTGNLVSICAIDNLCKGAAGQAVQCANIVFGLDEASGLEMVAMPI